MKNLNHKIAAAITVGVMAVDSSIASAQGPTNFSSVTGNIKDSASGVPELISLVAYIGGIGMGVAGIFKLKEHVDDPGRSPLKDGLIRLGAGGGLLTLPYITESMMGSVSDGSNNAVQFGDVNQFAIE